MDNSEFYSQLFGEETVEQMTTGETTADKNARALFPRVNFREVEDAEMVVAVLRNAAVDMVKRAAQGVQTVRMNNAVKVLGLQTLLTDQHGKETDGHSVVTEMTTAVLQMVGMVEAITAQIAAMYGAPDEDNAKYVSDLLEFATETREIVNSINDTNEALKAGER